MSALIIAASFILNALADSKGRSKLVLFCCCSLTIAASVIIRFSYHYAALLAASALFYFFNAPASPISDKLILDTLALEPERYSWFRLGGSIGYGIGALFIGLIIARFGLLSVFPVFALVMAICTLIILPIPGREGGKENAPREMLKIRDYGALIRHKRFFAIYGILALWGLAEAALSFFALHLQNHGFNSRYIGLLLATAMAGEVAGFLLTARLLKKTRPERVIFLSFVSQCIRSSSLALVLPLPFLVCCQFIGGFSFPMIWASTTQLVNATFPSRMGNVVQGFKVIAVNGLAQLTGVPLCGFLYQYVSSASIYWMITAVCIAYLAGYGISQSFYSRRSG
jgi:MFS family permease